MLPKRSLGILRETLSHAARSVLPICSPSLYTVILPTISPSFTGAFVLSIFTSVVISSPLLSSDTAAFTSAAAAAVISPFFPDQTAQKNLHIV